MGWQQGKSPVDYGCRREGLFTVSFFKDLGSATIFVDFRVRPFVYSSVRVSVRPFVRPVWRPIIPISVDFAPPKVPRSSRKTRLGGWREIEMVSPSREAQSYTSRSSNR